jgi:arylsulfatase A-like enzyme
MTNLNPAMSPSIALLQASSIRRLVSAVGVAVLAALGVGTVHAAAAKTGAAAPPHIIVILADDMGIGDLGCYGGRQEPTPRIDRLAREGTRFTQYYSAAPICSPSRCGLITGMFPARWSITSFLQARAGNAACEMADFLDPQAPSLPRTLKAAGYATAHFGKWHLGGGRDVVAPPKFAAYGYDENAGTWESPEPHPDITATNWIWSDQDKVKRWNRTAFFVDKTLDFLDRHRAGPCFINLWLDDVHTPWVPDEVSDRKDLPKNFRPVLAEMDRQIGRLLDGLKSRGLDENTLVIFTSDNGAMPTFQGARSGIYRGSKLGLYEGGIRMPFIVRWPGRVPAGRVDEQSVLSATDLLPTLSALAGARGGQAYPLDGIDASAIWRGAPGTKRPPLLWEYGRNEKSFKYPAQPRDRSPSLAVRRDNWKLLINADGSRAELYDLTTDPSEKTNLADAQPALTRELTEVLLAWRKSWPKPPATMAKTK